MPISSKVFLSYNTKDAPAVEEIAKKLVESGFDPWIDTWSMSPGDLFQEKIEAALETCGACLVFIGPSGLGPWQNKEMRAAIHRRVEQGSDQFRLVPILLPGAERGDRSLLPTFLQDAVWVEFRQTLDNPESFQRLVAGIKGLPRGPLFTDEVTRGQTPYRGLEVFDVEHAPFFLGREALTGWLLDKLRVTGKSYAANRFLAIVGASGSGKSSLARAGLAAALRNGAIEGSGSWPVVILRPGPNPLESLVVALSKTDRRLVDPSAASGLVDLLKRDESALHLTARLALADAPRESRLVVLVDQFEEVFTLCGKADLRRPFLNNLIHAAKEVEGQTVVVLTMRADFYGKCARFTELAASISEHQLLVGPMSDDELRLAIEQPALRVGCEFEPGLVADLVKEVQGQVGSLPLLQHTLLKLWEHREGRKLTFAAYHQIGGEPATSSPDETGPKSTATKPKKIGGLVGVLEQWANEVYNSYTDPTDKDLCRRIFLRLTQPGEDTEDTKRRAPLRELEAPGDKPERVAAVVDRLVTSRLVTAESEPIARSEAAPDDHPQFEDSIEVAHEALIRNWSRLRGWIEADRAGLRIHRRLTEDAEQWFREGCNPGFLYGSARLAVAKDWVSTHRRNLNARERDFLIESHRVEQARMDAALKTERERAEAAEQRAEDADSLRRRNRGLAVIGGLAVGLAVVSLILYFRSNEARKTAEERKTDAVKALGVAKQEKGRADTEAKNALRVGSISRAREFLALSQARMPINAECSLALALHAYDQAHAIADHDSSPFADQLRAALGQTHVVRTWSSASVAHVSWHPSEPLVAIVDHEGTTIRDVETGALRQSLPFKGIDIAWSPEGERLAIAPASKPVVVWDRRANQPAQELPESSLGAMRLTWCPDGKRLACAHGRERSIYIWDLASRTSLQVGPKITQWLACWSPNGKRLATGASKYRAIIWDAAEAKPLQVDAKHRSPLLSLAFSRDGRWLASGGDNGELRLWDTEESSNSYALPGHDNQILAISWGFDGTTLATASWDGTIKRWDLVSRSLIATLTGHGAGVEAMVSSPDGKQFATASHDQTCRIWNVEEGRTPRLLLKEQGWIQDILWSRDGRLLVLPTDVGDIVLLDGNTGQEIKRLTGLTARVGSLSFSPDEKRLVSMSSDGTIRFWDLEKGTDLERDYQAGHRLQLNGQVAWSPDGKTIAATFPLEEGSYRLLDAETGAIRTVARDTNVLAAAWQPKGKRLALSLLVDAELVLLDPEGDGPMKRLTGHTKALGIWGLAWSPDGKRLASGSDDRSARVWNAETLKCEFVLNGHQGEVKGVAWSPDGHWLATASLDKTIRIWDTRDGKNVAVLVGHTSGVRRIAWSPDGKRLASAGEDGTSRLFLTATDDLLPLARDQISRGLTLRERELCLDPNHAVTEPNHAPPQSAPPPAIPAKP